MAENYILSSVNNLAENNGVQIVSLAEKMFDNSITNVVTRILKNEDIDIVMLAGPSSSGKTTTAGKIAKKIRDCGRNAYVISLDDFYLNRSDIGNNSDGLPDYENVTALDLPMIFKTFNSLINSRHALVPVFNFNTGSRSEHYNEINLEHKDVIIVEGLHALNPIITGGLNKNHLFKIYISVSSRFVDDNNNVILSKRNIRFVRRIVRDYKFRGSSVENTFMLWSGVMAGEEKYLFPYEYDADDRINSIHSYEPCLFKQIVVPLLNAVSEHSEYKDEAQMLACALNRFSSVNIDYLPEKSLLHEFVG